MTSKILLKSFDNNTKEDRKIDLTQELLRIESEQQAIFQEKLKISEAKSYERISKELEIKFKIDLKKQSELMTKKYMSDLDMVTQKFSQNYGQYQQECMKIFDIFINHHLKKLNKQIIQQEIMDSLSAIFKKTPQETVMIIANEITHQEIQSYINMHSVTIDCITDNTLCDGDIHLKYKDGGICLSLENIMNDMNSIFARMIQNINQQGA